MKFVSDILFSCSADSQHMLIVKCYKGDLVIWVDVVESREWNWGLEENFKLQTSNKCFGENGSRYI